MLGVVRLARDQLLKEATQGMLRIQTDPIGVRFEMLALEKLTLRLTTLLTELSESGQ
jgi:hypothetical protein